MISGAQNIVVKNFIKECRILSSLRHPNIVVFVGFDEERRLIVMEYLHASLRDYIDAEIRDKKSLRKLQISEKHRILYDVGLGLQHLHEHEKPIVHRDLTANNILLTVKLQAKIADLGQAVIKQHNHEQYMTMAPGTLCYMPPEVLQPNPKYDESIDIFSYGVLVLHAIGEEWPIPSEIKIINSHTGDILRSRSEFERRESYVKKIELLTPLVILVKDCLHDSNKHRPNVMSVIAKVASAVAQGSVGGSKTQRFEEQSLVVNYTKNIHQNRDLKITYAESASHSKLCVIVRPPVKLGFTGTYSNTIPFSNKLYWPVDVAIDQERVYVCDYNGYFGVHVYDMTARTNRTMVPAATAKMVTNNRYWYPRGIATDGEGNVYLSDSYSHCVVCSSPQSGVSKVFGVPMKPGSVVPCLNKPSGIAVNRRLSLVYLCDTENHRVKILDRDLQSLHNVQLNSVEEFNPVDVAFDEKENFMYVLDHVKKKIVVFAIGNHEEIHTIDLHNSECFPLQEPGGICIDANNLIYITDKQKHRVLVLSSYGEFKMFFGQKGSKSGELHTPCGIAVDRLGQVYICDTGNRRIQVFV